MLPPGHEGLEGIIDSLEPESIPAQFVQGARIVDLEGNSYEISASELEDIVTNDLDFFEQGVMQIRLILNMVEAKAAIVGYTEHLLAKIPF